VPAIRQKLHLSPCADFRDRLFVPIELAVILRRTMAADNVLYLSPLGNVITIDDERIKNYLDALAGSSYVAFSLHCEANT
jgi:hypothetical protein